MASCSTEQVKAGVDQGLMQDADPRVRLTAMLRVADVAGAASGETLAAMVAGNAIGTDNILLDAWTSAASTTPVDTLVTLINVDQ